MTFGHYRYGIAIFAVLLVGALAPTTSATSLSYITWKTQGYVSNDTQTINLNRSGGNFVDYNSFYETGDKQEEFGTDAFISGDITASIERSTIRFSMFTYADTIRRGNASIRNEITAGFIDDITLTHPDYPEGTSFTFNGVVAIEGSHSMSITGVPNSGRPAVPYSTVATFAWLNYSGLGVDAPKVPGRGGVTPAFNAYHDKSNSYLPEDYQQGNFSPFAEGTFEVKVGQTLSLYQEVNFVTQSISASYFDLSTSSTATTSVSYDQTITWGGFSSVVLTETGQPVTGWTLTSESGFDYSVPEPTGGAALLIVAGAAIFRHRRANAARVG